MTDEIDLDELDVSDDAESDAADDDDANEGDWLWRDDSAADPPGAGSSTGSTGDPDGAGTDGESAGPVEDDAGDGADGDTDGSAGTDDASDRVPHVPRADKNSPVGVPASSGGAGGSSAFEGENDGATPPGSSDASPSESADASAAESGEPTAPEPSNESARSWGQSTSDDETGPHGSGADDMTLALTYGAVRRLETPAAAFADAATWTDWVGIVGDVDAPAINKFQRDHGVDVDFFNGTGTGPGERLAEIGPRSMFYADRTVLVGLEGEDESIAEAAGWEFVPLSEAAAEAGWECTA